MAAKFYKLPVRSIEKTTSDCSVVTFDIPSAEQDAFQFKQGQYLTLKAAIDGEEVRRSYSLCSSPLEGEWKVAVKKVPAGRFSGYINDVLQAGDVLEVMPPDGRFYVHADPARSRNFVAFAAGSGITPIASIIKTHLQAEPHSTFKLFYVNQAASRIILKDEIEGLKNLYLDRFEVFHFLTREQRSVPLFNGRIDREKLSLIFRHLVLQESVDDVFICGPREMIFTIRDFLLELGFDPKQIHFELFHTGQTVPKVIRSAPASINQLSQITVIEGGKTLNFSIPQKSNNILDAALEHKADLPFACKGGVCCTCRAKVVEGEVEMLVNYGLEPEELDQGYALTCQALPVSERVVIDFDGV